jgi:hypothetical protein
MTTVKNKLKIAGKHLLKGSLNQGLRLINGTLSTIHKKRGLLLVEFVPIPVHVIRKISRTKRLSKFCISIWTVQRRILSIGSSMKKTI